MTQTDSQSAQDRLFARIAALLEPMGYDLVYLEVQTHRQKTLRLFIDFKVSPEDKAVGIEDCVQVTKALDEPLDQTKEVDEVFHGASYELEVSSPGVDRPLRRERDFARFAGRQIRLNVFRPLSAEEIGNPDFHSKNSRQKTFLGKLLGIDEGKLIRLSLVPDAANQKKNKKAAKEQAASAPEVTIPLALVSKANLEPEFNFDRGPESTI